MKIKYPIGLYILALFIIILSCKKPDESTPKPFSLEGTWRMNGYFVDSLGSLFYTHSNPQFLHFYSDSVNQYLNNDLKTNLFGKYTLHTEDTLININLGNGLFSKIVGKKFLANFTKETYYTNDSNFISIDKTSFRADVFNIVNNDSIFGYSYCCRGFFSLIRQ
ncbi:MAG: hypothetical protein MH472_03240 [Bacteroidia bacterium]|nr:hypothetical protein [Bacteroidia bacterium]